jgi:hypothetical protein
MTHQSSRIREFLDTLDRLRRDRLDLELRYANLLAAARATLATARDREADPLSYLEDELTDHADHDGSGR